MKKKNLCIDYLKITACFFVLTGHILQGLIKSGLIIQSAQIKWFLDSIYLFHVQLFFLCSGYLYSLSGQTRTKDHLKNISYKAVSLGIPYFFFATLSWILRHFAGGSVNSENISLPEFLFVSPVTAPYWYLYTLFILFILIPNIKKRTGIAALAAVFLVLHIFSSSFAFSFVTLSVSQYGFWFILGMLACSYEPLFKEKISGLFGLIAGIILLMLFTFASFRLFAEGFVLADGLISLILGTLACAGFYLLFMATCSNREAGALEKLLIKYTFPVYLMHTIFAAMIRMVLLKAGILSPALHMICGIVLSVTLSTLCAWAAEKLIYPEFVIYPHKVINRFRTSSSSSQAS
ncbi:MAG: acyltransferase [Lachnospiraceae bacterium]|nr:acyltransferase [Lachnospiraceae bacterium]